MKWAIIVLVGMMVGGILVNTPTMYAQDAQIQQNIFGDLDDQINNARAKLLDILAPQNFAQAAEYYAEAKEDFVRGRDLKKIMKKVNASRAYLKKANEQYRLAVVTFATVLNARNDAIRAEAPASAPELFQKAEKKFIEAARKLEAGNVKKAKKIGGEAERLYREAELSAIKNNLLAETWRILEKAKKMDVEDVAPITYKKARELALEAEKRLTENRYDTDYPRSLARQALYEAKHAIYLMNAIREIKDKDISYEMLLLNAEEPLTRISGELDLVAEFDNGRESVVNAIIGRIQTMQDSLRNLQQRVEQKDQEIANLSARIQELEAQLGDIARQKSALSEVIAAQARLKQKFATIEHMFSRDEALVLRKGNDIIIRLVGLNFDVGKATINPQYFSLLTKVQQAIKVFPDSRIVVEGHTDSFGSDAMNLKLSQLRAEAVKAYLLANMNLDSSRVEAVGYGESRPIANNETPEGRAKNRRIDIVIKPNLPSLEASSLNIEQIDEPHK